VATNPRSFDGSDVPEVVRGGAGLGPSVQVPFKTHGVNLLDTGAGCYVSNGYEWYVPVLFSLGGGVLKFCRITVKRRLFPDVDYGFERDRVRKVGDWIEAPAVQR
jgi:hypothetical protein